MHNKIEDIPKRDWSNKPRLSIADTHPHLVSQWLSAKNCGFHPADFRASAGVEAWWRCPAKHIWQASIFSRTQGQGCPFCEGKIASPNQLPKVTLAEFAPLVAAQWHPTLNKELRPSDVSGRSSQSVWWLCQTCGYEWKALIRTRTVEKYGCNNCRYNVIDLSSPEYAYFSSYFDQSLNEGSNPRLLRKSHKIYWRCPKDASHVWRAVVLKPALRKDFCPFCSGSRLTEQQQTKVRSLLKNGMRISQIALAIGASRSTIDALLKQDAKLYAKPGAAHQSK